jgi:hypothetical protein
MKTVISSASWAAASLLRDVYKSAFVAVLGGIDSSEIVDAALGDTALTEAVMPRFEPTCTPPCDALLWRLETSAGKSLNERGLLERHWHRPPYALTVRLVQYQPGSMEPEILDEATMGTRGSRGVFKASVDRLVMRLVRDAALGRGRGSAEAIPAVAPHGLPGWLDALRGKWRDRLTVEWWSVGTATASLDSVMCGAGLGEITWYGAKAGHRYLADPFPWPGTNRILCEEMPLTDGVGRIVSVAETNGELTPPSVLLDDGYHHSYPCTFADGDQVYCIPESTERGATRIFRLDNDGQLIPLIDVAPHFRLADPTLFRWEGRYWLACTDLDLGEHDNLCLLHASSLTGPWKPHARWPVKIDVRGARPAGMLFNSGGRLFRPGQDCAATYGAAVAIHEILSLNETDFQESLVSVLRPDQAGPFPHGLHTLVHDGERFWLDGKRFVLELSIVRRKLLAKVARMFSGSGVD